MGKAAYEIGQTVGEVYKDFSLPDEKVRENKINEAYREKESLKRQEAIKNRMAAEEESQRLIERRLEMRKQGLERGAHQRQKLQEQDIRVEDKKLYEDIEKLNQSSKDIK